MADIRTTRGGFDLPGFEGDLIHWGSAASIGDEGANRVEASYRPERYGRLRELKRKWDPRNLFSHNQNIPQAG
jgi:FAD/FMN-containing dehydrogenase